MATVLGQAFNAKHIPGSLNVYTPQAARKVLGSDDKVVVHRTCDRCAVGRPDMMSC